MRLLLRTDNRLQSLYWITPQKNSITGWMGGSWLSDQLIPPDGLSRDFHFTYPADGNFHHSIKSFHGIPEFFISVFWDKVKVKTITENVATTDVVTRDFFDQSEISILSRLVPRYHLPSLHELPDFFQFPIMGFKVTESSFRKEGSIVLDKDVTDDDLIVSLNGLEGYSINVCGYLRTVSHPTMVGPIGAIRFAKSVQVSDRLVLDLIFLAIPEQGKLPT